MTFRSNNEGQDLEVTGDQPEFDIAQYRGDCISAFPTFLSLLVARTLYSYSCFVCGW